MTLVSIISAIGNNSSIYPLLVRDCGIENPIKIGLTYKQNLKDSKQMANNALRERTIDEYVWILKYDIYDMILSKRCLEFTSPHVACMTIGPKKRNLDGNSKNWKDRYLVCIRWNFIKEDIINFKNNKKTEA
jgi:hypothetical protein